MRSNTRPFRISEMIEKYMRLNKMTQSQLAEKLGKAESSVSMWISGKMTPRMGVIQKMADIFGITTDQLIFGDDYLEPISIEFNDYFPLYYCVNLSAGSPDELLKGDPDAIVYVPIKFQHMKDRIHAFKINGDSMNNVIPDGSIVVVEDVSHLSKIPDGKIVVAWINGEVTIKRLYITEFTISLVPDSNNKSFKPITVELGDDTVKIIGRVLWHMNPDNVETYY